MINTGKKFSRRRFLKTAALTSLYTTLWGCSDLFSKTEKGSVIVVGAGMSGISAARELQARGFHVTVLEGRDRIGGRIWTDNSLGTSVDLGGSWIMGNKGNPLVSLAKEFGAKTMVTDFDDGTAYDFDGSALTESQYEKMLNVFEELMDAVEESAESLKSDVGIGKAVRDVLKGEKLSPLEKRFVEYALLGLETESGADVDALSLQYADTGKGFEGDQLLLPEGGFLQIIKGLAKGLDIKFEEKVYKIDSSGKKVKVETSDKNYEADYVVVTIPLGLLKKGHVEFVPELPGAKKKAIERLGWGVLDKVALKFPMDKKDWPLKEHFLWTIPDEKFAASVPVNPLPECHMCHQSFENVTKKKGDFTEFLNMNKYGGGPVLVAITGGPFAEHLETHSDEDIVKRVVTILRSIFGKKFPEPEKFIVTRWMLDTFASGAYSHFRVGSSPKECDAIMEPVNNRVFFAGEATIKDYYATVHGAFLSGLREAKRIANL